MSLIVIIIGLCFALILICVMIAIFALLVKNGIIGNGSSKQNAVASNYESCVTLMTPTETAFFHALKNTLPSENYHIHSKVRMSDVVKVKKGVDRKQSRSALNRIDRKHVDFVLASPSDTTIYAVIELDDRSHQRKDRQKSDQFKNQTFTACGIPIIRFPVQPSYSSKDILAKVNVAFGR